jgi:predicted DCC family thiol-disulfide oxidoreductase YuxK
VSPIPSADPPRRRRVLYDGECSVCRALAAQAERRDATGQLVLVPYQTQDNSDLPAGVSTKDLECALHVVLEDGTTIHSGTAVMAVLQTFPPPWSWLGHVGSWGPFRWIANRLYGPFARHRRIWSRWIHDGGPDQMG